ncbi:MAG: hypothetical protein H0T60_10380 [Acidobacteria bacterium]|nr:hypothetical protein [Acidobacteriota bacterium]
MDALEQLKKQINSGHERLCKGREYTCECGWDDGNDKAMEAAAAEIETLRARVEAAEARAAELERRLADAVKALVPFAKVAQLFDLFDNEEEEPDDAPAGISQGILTVGDFRSADRAHASIQKDEEK